MDEDGERPLTPEKLIFGKRIIVEQFMQYELKFLCEESKKTIPEPLWPDPEKEPLPPPKFHQIVKRPPNRPDRPPISLFSIWTPKDHPPPEEGEEPLPLELSSKPTRWVIPAGQSKELYIKFLSKNVGAFEQTIPFEIVGSYKQLNLHVNAICEFPTINPSYRNVFIYYKKSRNAQPIEACQSKTYVVNGDVFDFGPLLINKDPEKRQVPEDPFKDVNASLLRITNNGKYQSNITFALKSSLPVEEGGSGEKSPFILDPDSMVLDIDETKDLTVFCFPDKAEAFKDEIIALIQDNPNPVIFPMQCLGAKPIVEVDSDIVEFDRLLLDKTLEKTLKISSACSIPVRWRLAGVADLPEEFEVSKETGILKPYKEEIITIKFIAQKEQKFNPKLTLEVEDNEG